MITQMIAHIRKTDGEEQLLKDHSRSVERLCASQAERLGLSNVARLVGLMHDMGKADDAFGQYIRSCYQGQVPNKHPHHAATGAIYAHERWTKHISRYERLTAQIVTLCIQGHHSGLADCMNAAGEIAFVEQLESEKENQNVHGAHDWFTQNIASDIELDDLFEKACQEVESFCSNMDIREKGQVAFEQGLLTRLVLSWLVDADRWDSACFEYGQDSLTVSNRLAQPWNTLSDRFESFLKEKLDGESEINIIRGKISDLCFNFAAHKSGIYTLSVPTGGGKTFASLRYALSHIMKTDKDRVFYIIPYNTILDQNAHDIREALGEDVGILEHHSNVVIETEDEQETYRRLTERWDMPIIMTSLVQFLNACFSGKNTDVRRFHRLTNAVLIFDEIQSLPKHCKRLFEMAVSFLAQYCGTTVLLCTATQPHIDTKPEAQEIIPNVHELYQVFSRVRFLPDIDESGKFKNRTNEDAALRLADLIEKQSVLAIVNTKVVAWDIKQRVTRLLQERGFYTADGMDSQHLQKDDAILCIHLSTNLCPAHRLHLLDKVKEWNQQGRRVFCISTALIEAGINVSFPVVVRSLTGLPSIVQAAGRCNRNMEISRGDVHIWHLSEEKLDNLPDVSNGITCSLETIDNTGVDNLDDPSVIESYFRKEEAYIKEIQEYPIKRFMCKGYSDYKNMTLVELLALNKSCVSIYRDFWSAMPNLALRQSFRTAGEIFEVIPEKTYPVLVPFENGKELIKELCASHTMQEEIILLRKAQRYTVNLYSNVFKRLCEQGAVVPVGESGVMALKEEYYSLSGGVKQEREEMKLLSF